MLKRPLLKEQRSLASVTGTQQDPVSGTAVCARGDGPSSARPPASPAGAGLQTERPGTSVPFGDDAAEEHRTVHAENGELHMLTLEDLTAGSDTLLRTLKVPVQPPEPAGGDGHSNPEVLVAVVDRQHGCIGGFGNGRSHGHHHGGRRRSPGAQVAIEPKRVADSICSRTAVPMPSFYPTRSGDRQ